MRFDLIYNLGEVDDISLDVSSLSSKPGKPFFTMTRRGYDGASEELAVLDQAELRELITCGNRALYYMDSRYK